MGKTAKSCSILVMDTALYNSVEVQTLLSKGHVIHPAAQAGEAYDVIIGPQCWRVDPSLGNLEAILEMVLKGVRTVKYGKGKKDAK